MGEAEREGAQCDSVKLGLRAPGSPAPSQGALRVARLGGGYAQPFKTNGPNDETCPRGSLVARTCRIHGLPITDVTLVHRLSLINMRAFLSANGRDQHIRG